MRQFFSWFRWAAYGAIAAVVIGLPFILVFPRREPTLQVMVTNPVVRAPGGWGEYVSSRYTREKTPAEVLVAIVYWKTKAGDREGALAALRAIKDDKVRDRVAAGVVDRFLKPTSSPFEVVGRSSELEEVGMASGKQGLASVRHRQEPRAPQAKEVKEPKAPSPALFIDVAREIKNALLRADALTNLATYLADKVGDRAGAEILFGEALHAAEQAEVESPRSQEQVPPESAQKPPDIKTVTPDRESWWARLGTITGWLILGGIALGIVIKALLEELVKITIHKTLDRDTPKH